MQFRFEKYLQTIDRPTKRLTKMSFIYNTPEKNVFSVVAPDAPRKELPHPNVNLYRGNHYYSSVDEEDSAGVMSISELMTPNPNVNLYRGNHYYSSDEDDEDDDSAGVMSISELMTPDPNVNMYRGNHYYASDDDSAGIMSISELTPDNAHTEDEDEDEDDEDDDESQTDIYEQIHPNPFPFNLQNSYPVTSPSELRICPRTPTATLPALFTNVTVRRVHRIPYEYEDSSDDESTTSWAYANRVNIIGYDE
jgi:hypothetical protein